MANEAGIGLTGTQGPLGRTATARGGVRSIRLRRLIGERPASGPWNAPLRPSGPVPPSSPGRRPVPVRPPGPVHPLPDPAPAEPSPPARPVEPQPPREPDGEAYLHDYATLMDAVPLPSLLIDRRWDVVHANAAFDALFRAIGPHPTAMPQQNFLRFVLFHPEARSVLAEHETSWCLPVMAQLAAALEEAGDGADDRALQAVRDDIALDPIMDAAYRCGLPLWISAVGAAALRHDGAVRPVHHPDPRWGSTDCRVVDETPAGLRGQGYTRLTLVLRENRSAVPGAHRAKPYLRAVSGG
ncbi:MULTISPECIES: transcriptional regulator [unclassified Streptomyces]|uniref:MmyB family transcriptional regulator n=1 Tax=unclassified Streptomyces TaxID=2593676 RepID=UPI0037F87973